MNDNRRYYTRFGLAVEACRIIFHGQETIAEAINQSLGGVCIKGWNPGMLIRDEDVTAILQGEKFEGKCRSVSRGPENELLIGVQWDKPSTQNDRMLIKTFVHNAGHYLVCEDITEPSAKASDSARIRFWNNDTLDVTRSQLVSLTEEDRLGHFEQAEYRQFMSRVYDLGASATARDIADFEFQLVETRCVIKPAAADMKQDGNRSIWSL